MATFRRTKDHPGVHYPTGDGKPVAETPTHRDNLLGLIEALRRHFADDPDVYISGNMFIDYVPGRHRRHVSPDVFVVRGIPDRDRDAYFVWEEGKGPDVVVELTSASTRKEDLVRKFHLYQDTLHVAEYLLFDPKEEYLDPSLRGYRLVEGRYRPIEPDGGRLPSAVLGLHLERHGTDLRLFDPAAGRWIPTRTEAEAAAEAARQRAEDELRHAHDELQRAEDARQRAEAERQQMAESLRQAEAARREAEAQRERLRRELEALRRHPPEPP